MTDRHQAGHQVALQLRTSEDALDVALAETLRLAALMVDARRAAGFGAALGQDALDEVLAGVAAINLARADVVSAHARLADLADAQGVIWKPQAVTLRTVG